jgi:hypothetical protein
MNENQTAANTVSTPTAPTPTGAQAKAPANRPDPMSLLTAFAEGELAKGIAEAKDFERFVKLALGDIMTHTLNVEKNQRVLFSMISQNLNEPPK